MKNVLALVAGVLGCLLLALYAAQTRRATIEEELRDRTKKALAPAPVGQLVIIVDGREITLRGQVPSEQAKRDAGKAVENTYGVHTVQNLLEIRPANATVLPPPSAGNTSAASLCQQEFNASLSREQIQFQPSWYAIQRASIPLLDELVAAANKCPDARIEISGHTDSAGVVENNLALSQARAQEVAKYLIVNGIAAPRLSVIGHGSNQPVADNATAEGRQKNRRIDFKVIAP